MPPFVAARRDRALPCAVVVRFDTPTRSSLTSRRQAHETVRARGLFETPALSSLASSAPG